jgi:5'-3' exonuclease
MGGPLYYKFLCRHHPGALVHRPPRVECLYLDFNGLVHQCVAESLPSRQPEQPALVSDTAIVQRVLAAMHRILRICCPRRLVVAMDGVPPLAKMAQQRKRRFMNLSVDSGWDTNAISPGTPFMRNLADAVRHTFPAAVVSDTLDPGEGEQKIRQQLQDLLQQPPPLGLPLPGGGGGAHVVYCCDADLVQLCLLLCPCWFPLMLMWPLGAWGRFCNRHRHTFLDVRRLAQLLFVDSSSPPTDTACFTHRAARDHILLFALFGNDIVPGLPCLHLDDHDVQLVQSIYLQHIRGAGAWLVEAVEGDEHVTWGVSRPALLALLTRLQPHERACMTHKHEAFVRRGCPAGTASCYEALHPRRQPAWRTAFYQLVLHSTSAILPVVDGGPAAAPAAIKQVCHEFMASLDWLAAYYFHSGASPSWMYPFTHGPLVGDLVHYLNDQPKRRKCANHSRPAAAVSPDLHLLVVLPPSSAHLLPDPRWRAVHSDPVLGCQYMYPTHFTVVKYLKFAPCTYEPLLPAPCIWHLLSAIHRLCMRPPRLTLSPPSMTPAHMNPHMNPTDTQPAAQTTPSETKVCYSLLRPV